MRERQAERGAKRGEEREKSLEREREITQNNECCCGSSKGCWREQERERR